MRKKSASTPCSRPGSPRLKICSTGPWLRDRRPSRALKSSASMTRSGSRSISWTISRHSGASRSTGRHSTPRWAASATAPAPAAPSNRRRRTDSPTRTTPNASGLKACRITSKATRRPRRSPASRESSMPNAGRPDRFPPARADSSSWTARRSMSSPAARSATPANCSRTASPVAHCALAHAARGRRAAPGSIALTPSRPSNRAITSPHKWTGWRPRRDAAQSPGHAPAARGPA